MDERVEFALFDAGLLTQPQREQLRDWDEVVWGYADIADPRAQDVGPVWMPLNSQARSMVQQLWADPVSPWAASEGEAAGDFDRLSRHFKTLRYVRTHDDQRYFFRYADTRCLSGMASALKADRYPRLMGPVLKWRYWARNGKPAALANGSEQEATQDQLQLRLRADELSALLDACWPDQLLGNALELQAQLEAMGTLTQRYEWAHTLCQILKKNQVEAYPVQLEAMLTVLRTRGQALSHPKWEEALTQAERQGEPGLLAALA